ncbi:MAG: LamG domain-containing protein, partial [bacterium]|nr:LamG domain-containing protein [bacterium]
LHNGTITIGAGGTQTTAGTCNTPTGGTGAWYNGKVGKMNSALSFDGTDDYVDTGTGLGKPSAFTISAWIKPDSWGNTAPVDSVPSSGADKDAWGIVFRNTGDVVEIAISDGSSRQTFTVASDWNSIGYPSDRWTHIVATVDGTDLTYYKNGALVNTTSQTVQNGGTAYKLSIGRAGEYAGFYFDGLIDDVRIYNYALTPQQIKLDYNQGSAVRFGPASGRP